MRALRATTNRVCGRRAEDVAPVAVAGLFPGVGAVNDTTLRKCRGLGFPKPRAASPKVGGSNKALRLCAVL